LVIEMEWLVVTEDVVPGPGLATEEGEDMVLLAAASEADATEAEETAATEDKLLEPTEDELLAGIEDELLAAVANANSLAATGL